MGVEASQIVKDDGNAIAQSKVHVTLVVCSSPERASDIIIIIIYIYIYLIIYDSGLSLYHLRGLRNKRDSTQPTGRHSYFPLSSEGVWGSYTRGPSGLVF